MKYSFDTFFDQKEKENQEQYKKDLWFESHPSVDTITIEIGGKEEILLDVKEALLAGGDVSMLSKKYQNIASELEKISAIVKKGIVDARSPIAMGHDKGSSFNIFVDIEKKLN